MVHIGAISLAALLLALRVTFSAPDAPTPLALSQEFEPVPKLMLKSVMEPEPLLKSCEISLAARPRLVEPAKAKPATNAASQCCFWYVCFICREWWGLSSLEDGRGFELRTGTGRRWATPQITEGR